MKEKFKNTKGITLIALVITIIVLLILAGVSIATLMGDNGILTNASRAKTEDAHANVREAISLAYSEYIMELEIDKTGDTTKIASTENVKIRGIENHVLASGEEAGTFKDFLTQKGYIDDNGVINVEKLVGSSLSIGKGNATDKKDVYILEETADAYILKYYDDKGNTEETPLWQVEKESVVGTKTLDIYYTNKEIAFSIEYEEGMVWGEWCESEYNTTELKVNSYTNSIDMPGYSLNDSIKGTNVEAEEEIDENAEYTLISAPL